MFLATTPGLQAEMQMEMPGRDIWVDPVEGSDSATGENREAALRTLAEAWRRVPVAKVIDKPITIALMAGEYPESAIPEYLEDRHGGVDSWITIQSADGPGRAILRGDLNVFNVEYLAVVDLTIAPGGDAFHCEQCSHLTLRGVELDGSPDAWETLKVNQSVHIEVLDSDIHGAGDNAIDFVAVRHAVVRNNTIHDADDWCAYAKGGSIDIVVEGNEIYDCGTGGFTAGQGSGFQYMVPPNLTYEAEDVTVRGNRIHDIEGAGIGVAGGHNILIEENHMKRVGDRSHLLEIVYGGRTCDGPPEDESRERCAEYLDAGGWGTAAPTGESIRIPNKDVVIRNNVIENPPGYQSQWQHFWIAPPVDGLDQTDSGVPLPLAADDGLVITGNTINNGAAEMPLGVGGEDAGCQDVNPTCNAAQLLRDNNINGD